MFNINQRQECGCTASLFGKELAHRTANLLQGAIATVSLCQRGRSSHVEDAVRRLTAAVRLHHLLGASHVGLVQLSDTLPDACSAAVAAHAADDRVHLYVDCPDTLADAEAARVLLMVAAELVGNSVRHAFGTGSGSVLVVLTTSGLESRLLVEDNGTCTRWTRKGGQGCGIVDDLARAMGGTVSRIRTQGGSSRVVVSMPRLAAASVAPAGSA